MTQRLFVIQTTRVFLSVDQVQERQPGSWVHAPRYGRLEVRRAHEPVSITRAGVADVGTRSETGPVLYEHTDYLLFLEATSGSRVELGTRDPILVQGMRPQRGGRVLTGLVNFGGQVGRSVFEVCVDGATEFEFELEVFPSKLDYMHDYKDLLADVQQLLTGLALAYLRSAYRLGQAEWVKAPSSLEWLTLLREIFAGLELALNFIARSPIRRLQNEPRDVAITRARPDARVRAAIRAGSGLGPWVSLAYGRRARSVIPTEAPLETLDTAEHGWLAAQLRHVARELSRLRDMTGDSDSVRHVRTLAELMTLQERVQRLMRLEPVASASERVVAGFASLQLMRAPGYREAYQLLTLLKLGLRLEGTALRLAPKDIAELYEYWCYLSLVRLLGEELEVAVDPSAIFEIRSDGLQVRLGKGRQTAVALSGKDREIRVVYNPRYDGNRFLVAQQPDMVVAVSVLGWDEFLLIVDAKYQVRADVGYLERYRLPGPPEDSLNVLHRYRDALLDEDSRERPQLKRTVVEAVAMYPFRDSDDLHFDRSRFSEMLERIGIGALPALPGSTEHVTGWLKSVVARTGWEIAGGAIGDRATDRLSELRNAAIDPVLVASGELEQQPDMTWTFSVEFTSADLLTVRWVSLVAGLNIDAIFLVTEIQLVPSAKQSNVVYGLRRPVRRRKKLTLESSQMNNGWLVTSRLAWERAETGMQLGITSENEWRLYDNLIRLGLEVRVGGRVSGESWLLLPDKRRIRVAGSSHFMVQRADGTQWTFSRLEDVLDQLQAR